MPTQPEAPRFVDGPALRIAGHSARYHSDSAPDGIPAQWRKFALHVGHIPGQLGFVTYGVLCNPGPDGMIDYIAGVEVSDFLALPDDFATLEILPRYYAVFTHRGHVSEIRNTWAHIMSHGLKDSGAMPAGFPEFERYGEDFNPATGSGTIEIWIPVKKN